MPVFTSGANPAQSAGAKPVRKMKGRQINPDYLQNQFNRVQTYQPDSGTQQFKVDGKNYQIIKSPNYQILLSCTNNIAQWVY
jgi:hypothetical protein